ncbi:MAG TPA: preprotein translocase subunit YajC [Candidatus Omnitrophota bacterium]|nr:preprotein translocase subunit YajC [Candidatus Omnitrophota bacterium]HPS36425.1 preprotein translocase subunit YajC [Candidatus Omnitrophota bacterium]
MFESIAYAADGAPAGQGGALMTFLPMYVMIFVVFYFFMIRPQQKKQKELQNMIANLKKGDRVITSGGIIGVITGIQNDYFVLKIGDSESTKMEVLKSAIIALRTQE